MDPRRKRTIRLVIALSVRAAHAHRYEHARRLVSLTATLGLAFLALKIVEWVRDNVAQGSAV